MRGAGRAPRPRSRPLGPRRPRPRPRRRRDRRRCRAPRGAGGRAARRAWACPTNWCTPSRPTTPRRARSSSGRIDVALIAADQTTGLITAATLVRPDHALPRGQAQVRAQTHARGRLRARRRPRLDPALRRARSRARRVPAIALQPPCRAWPPTWGWPASEQRHGRWPAAVRRASQVGGPVGGRRRPRLRVFQKGRRFLAERHPAQAAMYLERRCWRRPRQELDPRGAGPGVLRARPLRRRGARVRRDPAPRARQRLRAFRPGALPAEGGRRVRAPSRARSPGDGARQRRLPPRARRLPGDRPGSKEVMRGARPRRPPRWARPAGRPAGARVSAAARLRLSGVMPEAAPRWAAVRASVPACAMASRMSMRFWMGGCVSNRPADSLRLLALERVGDVEVRGGPGRDPQGARVGGDLLQGVGQTERVARELDARGVG